MTVRARVRAAARTLWGLATLPPALLHETMHATLARRWAEDSVVVIDPAGGRAAAGVEWADDVPAWALRAAHYGPLILGSAMGVSAVLAWLLTGRVISTGSLWLDIVLAVWWVVFTMDSAADRAVPDSEDGGTSA